MPRFPRLPLGLSVALAIAIAVAAAPAAATAERPPPPEWAQDAVWYQIFPERFANGDPSNDPTRSSLNHPEDAPASWKVMDWTASWYDRAAWEREASPGFYSTVLQRRYGGDLQGVIDRLDYLEKLGVNAIYFNPVFYADSLHKYDGNTFHHIDPHFGPDPEGDLAQIAREDARPSTWEWTAADRLFLRLIEEAHRRGIRVIIDGVWNHTGRDCFAFQDLLENQRKSRYARWYRVTSFDDPRTARDEFDYRGWHGHKSLPEFADAPAGDNLASGPRRYVFHCTRRWMDPNGDGDPSDGVDGWRLDVAQEVPAGFWREWHALVRDINPEAFTVAEIWGEAADFLRRGRFDASMNYAGFAIPLKGWLIDGTIGASEFASRLAGPRESFAPGRARALQNLVASHDTQRVASAIANRAPSLDAYDSADWFDYDASRRVHAGTAENYDIRAPGERGRRIWKMVAFFQAAYVGAPMIYYGAEAGMWGGDDPDDRMPMWWPEKDFEPLRHRPSGAKLDPPEPVGFDRAMFATYREAMRLRREHPALRRGSFEAIPAGGESVFAFAREHAGERLVAVFNRGDADVGTRFFGGDAPELLAATDPGANALRVPAMSAAVYRAAAPRKTPRSP